MPLPFAFELPGATAPWLDEAEAEGGPEAVVIPLGEDAEWGGRG